MAIGVVVRLCFTFFEVRDCGRDESPDRVVSLEFRAASGFDIFLRGGDAFDLVSKGEGLALCLNATLSILASCLCWLGDHDKSAQTIRAYAVRLSDLACGSHKIIAHHLRQKH